MDWLWLGKVGTPSAPYVRNGGGASSLCASAIASTWVHMPPHNPKSRSVMASSPLHLPLIEVEWKGDLVRSMMDKKKLKRPAKGERGRRTTLLSFWSWQAGSWFKRKGGLKSFRLLVQGEQMKM
ncbi:hypothetical protein NC652_010258 [Populus alba x Populus x berolinensis]|nr:hypothetical protein NC652_010258 [Populus alba x Populus x berolinensis]